ncbi:MAG: LuxR family transcriptional regulator [Betaproteobacteria bacterium]|nr:LuxR family transcriptional regulator [Betaproteobacteria bacterium]
MLQTLTPSLQQGEHSKYIPPLLLPLISAAEKGLDLRPVVERITLSFGFNSFMYGMSTTPSPDRESRSFVYTTLPAEWVRHYDQAAYIEIDPRIIHTFDNVLPFIWDQRTDRGINPRTDRFLDDAKLHGIASGVCFSLYNSRNGRVIVALNSAIPMVDEIRQSQISRNLSDIVIFGHFFHQFFMKSVTDRNIPPASTGAPLSQREKQCLVLAARGLTSDDIAAKLEISARTVQFHFDAIRSKLNAANRGEAIAHAIKAGLIAA